MNEPITDDKVICDYFTGSFLQPLELASQKANKLLLHTHIQIKKIPIEVRNQPGVWFV